MTSEIEIDQVITSTSNEHHYSYMHHKHHVVVVCFVVVATFNNQMIKMPAQLPSVLCSRSGAQNMASCHQMTSGYSPVDRQDQAHKLLATVQNSGFCTETIILCTDEEQQTTQSNTNERSQT